MPIHTSRSRYEAFFRCPRYGYFQYALGGRGIVRKPVNVFLGTGKWTHKGFEMIFKSLMKEKVKELKPYQLDYIITQIKNLYFEEVFPKAEREAGEIKTGFDLAEEGEIEDWQGDTEYRQYTDAEMVRIQQQTFNEQAALVEALLRVFVIRILPGWMEKFRIVTVENDMAFPLVSEGGIEIIQSATIDVVLQEYETKDIYIVSFKTASSYTDKNAKRDAVDIQGMSETWAFEEYLKSKGKNLFVAGVKMLHVIKGRRAETSKGSRIYEQKSPLIKGYRKMGLDEIEYAHSLFYPKPENESGWGRLGKGWEPFDVTGHEGREVGGIKGWIEKLSSKQIQPENGDILAEQIIEPLPYDRKPWELDRWLRQTKARELDIAKKLVALEYYKRKGISFEHYLDENFPQNNSSCYGMYGGSCPYLARCWGTPEERMGDPIDQGFKWREPHHKAELIQIEGMK